MKDKSNSKKLLSSSCRLCGYSLPEKAIYQLDNIPRGVQYFSKEEDLKNDNGIIIKLFQCLGCGHIQLDSEPVVYEQDFTSATKYSRCMLNYRKGQIKDFIDKYDLKGKEILDVGCGDGHMLDIIRDQGAVGIGVDISVKALEAARMCGHIVYQEYVSRQSKIERSPFDAFICNDVIEHVSDIRDFLLGIANNLKPRGIGMLQAPSFEKMLETRRFYDFIPDHIHYFTLDTLRLAFKLSGFEVINSERNRDGENLTIIARKRLITDFGPMRTNQNAFVVNICEYIKKHKADGRRVAIWGASMQTIILASIISLDIAYVIDSAAYKQNRLTPVSHLPIVSPETLKTDPVDVIIINTPIYEEEILEQIMEVEKFEGTIASCVDGKIEVLRKA